MQPSDRAPDGVTAATSVGSSEPMLEALKQLYRAFQRSSIYPHGHPTVPQAFDEATRLLGEVLASAESVLVTAAADHLSIQGKRLDDGSGTLGALATLLHQLDLAAVDFRSGIERVELETFVRALEQARRDGVKGTGFVEAIAPRVQHLDVTPIDYSALRFEEGPRESGAPPPDDLWESLGEMLTQAPTSSADPEEMAQEIDQDIEEGAGIEVVRERITRLSKQINQAKPEKRAAGRSWLTKFVSALNPRLRSDLLRIDPRMPESSLETMHELADVIPEKELFDALQKIDRTGGRLPDQLMTLMNKLMRLSHRRPTLRRGIDQTIKRVSPVRKEADVKPVDLRGALGEVLQRRGTAEFNPRPYQSLLDGLAVQTLPGRDTESTAIYRNARDADDVALHAAEVAVRLAALPGGEQHRPGVFHRVATETERLLGSDRLDELRDAAVSARGYSLHKHAGDATRHAAKSLLERFKDERCIALTIAHARNEGSLSDAAKILLELGGVTALGMMLDTLDDKLARSLETDLQSAAAERSPEQLRKVLLWRAERGWRAVRPIFPVLRLLEPEVAAELLDELLGHEELEVRREALLTLVAFGQSDALLNSLGRGLDDRDPRLVTVAIRSLAELRDERALEQLGAYIEGALPSARPTLECATLAVRCLARRGEHGVQRLAGCLDRLGRSCRPLRVRLAFRVRDELLPHAGVEGIAETLRRWRFSAAWMVGLLTPGKRARGDGDRP